MHKWLNMWLLRYLSLLCSVFGGFFIGIYLQFFLSFLWLGLVWCRICGPFMLATRKLMSYAARWWRYLERMLYNCMIDYWVGSILITDLKPLDSIFIWVIVACFDQSLLVMYKAWIFMTIYCVHWNKFFIDL